VDHAVMFLEGKSRSVLEDYANKMEEASNDLAFEKAAKYRDQIAHLQRIQESQYVSGSTGDIDVMSAIVNPGGTCVLVMMIRGGRMLGNKTFFPRIKVENTPSEVLSAFIPRFYLAGLGGREIPKEIIVNAKIPDKSVITDVLSETANRKVAIADSVRGHRNRWLQLANTNAEQSLGGHLANRNNLAQRFSSLQNVLKLDEAPERLECFDISHSSGEATVASCVVFRPKWAFKIGLSSV
jgi:excinuclease ABC subunit C